MVNRFYFIALTVLALALGYLSYQILKPFLSPIAWAVILAIVFYPVYIFILRFTRVKAIASLLTIIIITVIIIGPFSYLSFLLVNELTNISEYLKEGKFEALTDLLNSPRIKGVVNGIVSFMNMTEEEMKSTLSGNISRLGKEIVVRIAGGVGDIVTGAVNFVFMVFSIFFLLKDGPEFLRKTHDYMPFPEEQKERLEVQIRDIIVSTVYGGVLVAIVQGIIGGVTYYILGVPSPVFWGLSTAVASFIPLVGAAAVWVPAAGYLFIKGFALKGVILAIVGIFGISLIDNILKPIIIGGRTKMPILIIFFSVLGGIKLFGLIGLIAGPLVMAIFVSVVEIFRNIEGGKNA